MPVRRTVNLYLLKKEMRTSAQRSGQWPRSVVVTLPAALPIDYLCSMEEEKNSNKNSNCNTAVKVTVKRNRIKMLQFKRCGDDLL